MLFFAQFLLSNFSHTTFPRSLMPRTDVVRNEYMVRKDTGRFSRLEDQSVTYFPRWTSGVGKEAKW